ncbi:hypothetical protein JT06_19165 [Desulfobulbus sp. Tol-SR]|jgi:hypothetical protein|nr:hypothetical protein JT06_19165 [Desulfobulbus sp. Tol-SR]
MSLNHADQYQKVGTFVVDDPVSAMNIVLGWQPRYVRAFNVNNLASYEYFSGMSAGTSLDNGNHADTQWSVNAAGSISLYAGRASGSTITGTVAVTAGSATVTGTSTNFIGELVVGDKIMVNGETRVVAAIATTTSLTTETTFDAAASAVSCYDMSGKGPGFTLGTDICDTAADVVRWLALR